MSTSFVMPKMCHLINPDQSDFLIYWCWFDQEISVKDEIQDYGAMAQVVSSDNEMKEIPCEIYLLPKRRNALGQIPEGHVCVGVSVASGDDAYSLQGVDLENAVPKTESQIQLTKHIKMEKFGVSYS